VNTATPMASSTAWLGRVVRLRRLGGVQWIRTLGNLLRPVGLEGGRTARREAAALRMADALAINRVDAASDKDAYSPASRSRVRNRFSTSRSRASVRPM
jgi:hypothetical protein